MKKQILSLILVLAMVMTMSVTAFATDINGDGDTADVKLMGEIMDDADVCLISVVVPTSINFQVGTKSTSNSANQINNPSVSAGGREFVRLVSGTGTVTNNTEGKAIKLDITNVSQSGDGNLLDLMYLAVAEATTDQVSAMNNKLTDGAVNINLSNSIAGDGGTLKLKVFGQGAQGVFNTTPYPVNLPDGDYTVTVTMKVTLVA